MELRRRTGAHLAAAHGHAFKEPVLLAPQQRSYTFTPALTGARTVELRASYATAIVTQPPKRRRATSGSGFAATECPAVRATRSVEVRGCSTEPPQMDAPSDVDAGEAFAVSVATANDDRVEWIVENGSVRSDYGSTAVVVAGASGKVVVTANVRRAGGCVASASAEVPIILAAGQCPNAPQAALTLLDHDCDSARVLATFTGTPPFAGEWSDGTDFETFATTLTHEFPMAGLLTLNRFHDASCYGSVTAAPTISRLQPKVTLTGTVACSTGKLTARFEGVAPFSGTWSDGQTFTTSEPSVERTVGPGDWSVVRLTDSACSSPVTSGVVSVPPPPTARVMEDEPYCQTSQYGTYATVRVDGGTSPYLVVWSDGHVSQSGSPYVERNFPFAKTPSRTWTVDRVLAGGCEVEVLAPNSVTVLWRDYGWFGPPTANSHCVATDVTKTLTWVPEAPGAQLTWTIDNPDVKIIAGQGTPTITLRSEKVTTATLRVETTYPDGYCKRVSDSDKLTFRSPSNVDAVQVFPDTIKPFTTAQVSVKVTGVPESLFVKAARGTLSWTPAANTWIYADTVGTPGIVPITVTWSDPCVGTKELVTTVTIAP